MKTLVFFGHRKEFPRFTIAVKRVNGLALAHSPTEFRGDYERKDAFLFAFIVGSVPIMVFPIAVLTNLVYWCLRT